MITELQQVTKKYFSVEDNAYQVRLNANHRRRIFWCTLTHPTWVIQIIDNDGNQIGDANFAANKRCLADTVLFSYTEPTDFN